MLPNIHTIIVTYNGEKWIQKCLESLLSNDLKTEIIIIDNGSSDQTIRIVEGYKQVSLIQNDTNLGFGKANNIGIIKALESNADFVFLLNQDAYVESTTISHLVDIQNRYPEYGIVSPIHLNGEGSAIDLRFSHYLSPEFCKNLYSDIFLGYKYLKEIYEISFVNAAGWLISRKALDTVGGFNPLFFHYGEDYEYIKRIKFHGLKVGVDPKSILYHDRKGEIKKHLSIGEQSTKKLMSLLDINKTNRVDQELKRVVREISKNIILFRFKSAFMSIKYFMKLKSSLKIIYRSRSYTSSGGHCYLDGESIKTSPLSIFKP